MTPTEKLQILLGVTDPALLDVLYEDAVSDVLAWTNRQTIPAGLEPAVRQLAILRYNKVGIEGEISHSEGGVSRSFTDLPADMQQTIGQFRLLKVVGRNAT